MQKFQRCFETNLGVKINVFKTLGQFAPHQLKMFKTLSCYNIYSRMDCIQINLYWCGVFLALNKQLKTSQRNYPCSPVFVRVVPNIPAWSASPPSPSSAVKLMNRSVSLYLGQNWTEKISVDQLEYWGQHGQKPESRV